MKGYPLEIELVPQTAWGHNLRSLLSKSQWDHIRQCVYESAQYRCEICQGKGSKHPVECHEIWSYNEDTRLQTLKGLQALCPWCHQVKHLGFAKHQGSIRHLIEHMMKVNGTSTKETQDYIDAVFAVQRRRATMSWIMDLRWLTNHYACQWTQASDGRLMV